MNSLRLSPHLVRELRASGHVTHYSRPILTPDGTLVPTDLTATPEPDGYGHTFTVPGEILVLFPRTRPGSVLCVKERWKVGAWTDGHVAVDYAADHFARPEWLPVREPFLSQLISESLEDLRKAGCTPDDTGRATWEVGKAPTRWRRPETMRISLSRAAAQATSVHPVRLSDLTEHDAIDAGMLRVSDGWLEQHFPAWFARLRRVNQAGAARGASLSPGPDTQLTAPPPGPSPLTRLRAAIRRGHDLHPDQDAWVWATRLHLLHRTPHQIRQSTQETPCPAP
ncbi:hypothetical protein [Deinococcus sp. JMULE3]|uniref:hypothetical protein n=1 Tax=Deinococcus sp. JMULE3 TaxID=2518341 RepID=UPI0015765D58|nr:hypothetical protein [Deinococcus sp. JMULE3]NTX99237.1 hypothetical protein [Deinococcus sp. JMULE3]